MTTDSPTIVPTPAGQLTSEQLCAWSDLQRSDPSLGSPYFRPEFTLAVAEVCDNVEVAVIELAGNPVGFFPYQRVNNKHAIPVGGVMSDFQGVVQNHQLSMTSTALFQACGLVSWDFDHLLADQTMFREHHCLRSGSPYMDLSRGYDAYLAERQQAGSKRFFQNVKQSVRVLARDIGPLRLECATTDPDVFRTLLSWKNEQYRRTKTTNIFNRSWTQPLLETIFHTRSPEFSGMLAALYAGERLVSVMFGMVSGNVFHNWFPAYDSSLPSRYSPGHALTLEFARAAERLGIDRIDLGKGSEPYKRSLMSGEIALAEGAVDLRPVPRLLKRSWILTREQIRTSRFGGAARQSKQLVRPLYEWLLLNATLDPVEVESSSFLS